MTGVVYSIMNTRNGKRYIGSTTDAVGRWKNHSNTLRRGDHHNCHLQSAYRKYGPDAFEYEVLMVCDADMRHAFEEMAFGIFRHSGLYNVKSTATGGDHRKGTKHSESAKAKISEAAKKQDWTQHTIAMIEWQANRSPDMEAERRRKISEKMKLVRARAPAWGKRTATSPLTLTEDTRTAQPLTES